MKKFVSELPALYSPEVRINHTIFTDWGSLQVSDRAHATYELQPFVPSINGGFNALDNTGTDQDPTVHIALLAPDEPNDGLAVKVSSVPGSLLITATIPYTKEQLIKERCRAIAEQIRLVSETDDSTPDSELLDIVRDEFNAPIEESLGDHVGQDMANALAVGVGALVAVSAAKKIELDQTRSFLKTIRQHGRYLVASTLTAVGATNLPGTENLGIPYRIVTPGLVVGPQVVGIYLAMKQYLQAAPERGQEAKLRATVLASNVQQGILDIYSRSSFDEQFGEMFPPSETD